MTPAPPDGRSPAGGRPSAYLDAPPGLVPSPRPAADALPVGDALPPAPVRVVPLAYADGTALSRYLPGAPERRPWTAWARPREPRLAVSVASLVELRVTGALLGHEARVTALDAELRLLAVRLSDRAVEHAALLLDRLPPFAALHVGAARAEPRVRVLATYDAATAQVAVGLGLRVVTPGRPDGWWSR